MTTYDVRAETRKIGAIGAFSWRWIGEYEGIDRESVIDRVFSDIAESGLEPRFIDIKEIGGDL